MTKVEAFAGYLSSINWSRVHTLMDPYIFWQTRANEILLWLKEWDNDAN